MSGGEDRGTALGQAYVYRRHTLAIRLLHWLWAWALMVLFLSGLQIFNAHPALYWGKSSYAGPEPFFEITARPAAAAVGELEGVTRVGTREFDTTGVLGASRTNAGVVVERAFPQWLTLPSGRGLALGRRWHFFFAWVLVLAGLLWVGHAVANRRLGRDLLPSRLDWRALWPSVLDHLRLRRARGEAARRYNVLQKLTYVAVMLGLLPCMVVTGLAMSPWIDSLWPGWVDWFGGRQSARTLHFLGAWLIVLFVLVHVFEVIATGPINNLRSMLTGRYRVEPGAAGVAPVGARR
jgi:thiosulfate reductase cytochrome b subunit